MNDHPQVPQEDAVSGGASGLAHADVEAPLLVGVPDGGGLRQAFAGLATLRVPPLRSVLVTACTLTALLVAMTVFVTGADAVLGFVLAGRRLAAAAVFGVLGLLAALGSLVLLLGLALDGPTQPRVHVERHPLRLAAGLGLLLLAAVCALLWVHGVTGS